MGSVRGGTSKEELIKMKTKRDWDVIPFRNDGIGYLEEFEQYVADQWVDPTFEGHDATVLFNAVCFAGEAGEVCDSIKKVIRGKETSEDVLLEMGDALHYLARLANSIGYSLNDVILANVKKLEKRKSEGKPIL